VKCTICGEEFQLERARLKLWLNLGSLQDELQRAVEERNRNRVAHLVCLYVSTALNYSLEEIENAPWTDIAETYARIINVNHVDVDLPMIKFRGKGASEDLLWDYNGRDWYEWAHTLAKEYSWTLDYIAELDVIETIHIMQEVAVDHQLDREWEWMLSEKSVQYEKSTKQSRFVPLERPQWMATEVTPPEVTRIPAFMMPVGNIKGGSTDVKH